METENNRILIVDDNTNNLQVLGDLLRTNSYKITASTSGQQALTLIERVKPGLILLDVMMPEMDGYEVARKLKTMPDYKDIPVIFLTAKTDTEDVVIGFQSGGVDYVTKPFRQEEILVRIKTHLDLKKSRDIIKKQNQELLESEKELKKLNADKDRFFSIIAHDLKNPFSTLIGFSELLIEGFPDMGDSEKIDMIDEMRKTSINTHQLLENLLIWSRAQTGRISYNPEEIILHELFSDVVNLLSGQAKLKSISVGISAESGCKVLSDYNMLYTIIRNMISNAIKFTPEKGKISIYTEQINDSTKIKIIDSGVGMDENTINNLFKIDVNSSTAGTNGETGTGLGLILTHEFVTKMNGTIEVQSKPGEGSTFTITLPNVN